MSRQRKKAQEHGRARRRVRWWWAAGILGVALAALALVTVTGPDAHGQAITVWKSPSCGCCGAWVDHLRAHGFDVTVIERDDLRVERARLGVPDQVLSCHTAEVGGYVVEGHVPAEDILRMLDEQPRVSGMAVPGMPAGSPGMVGAAPVPYDVVLFDRDGPVAVYARH